MVQTHQDSREEGTTTTIPPRETEKICHGSPDPQKVAPSSCTIESILTGCIIHRLVWQLLGTGAKLPAIQDLYTKNGQKLQPPKSQTVLSATARQVVPEPQVKVEKAP